MADNKKISELAPAENLNGNEEFEILQAGANKRATLTRIKTFIDTNTDINTDDVAVLRELELTHLGTLTEHIAHSASPYISIGADITDNGNGTLTISEAEVWIKITNNLDADFKAVKVPEITLPISENANIILYVDYNAGTPIFKQMVSSAGYFYSNWDKIPFATVVNIGTKIIINDFKDTATNGVFKSILGQINYQPFRYLGGLAASDGGTRNPVITAGALLFSNDYYATAGINTLTGGTFTRMYVTSGTWTRTSGQTQINNTQYNNLATGLVDIDNNKYVNKWFFHIKDTPSYWVLIEGQNQYNDLASAQAAGIPSSLPPEISPYYAGSILVAKFIVKQGQSAFQDIQNPFKTPFVSTTASLHNNLSGLQAAGVGVEWGHINNANQTIYGNKGLSTELISTWDSYVSALESFFNAIAFVAEDSGMFLTDNCYMGVGGVWKFKHTGYHASQIIIGYGKFNVFISTVAGTAGNSITFVEAFTVDKDGIVKIGIQPNTATITHPVLYRNPTNGYVEQFTQLKQTSVASSATPTPTGDGRENEYYLTALAAGATFAAPSGTPTNGNTLIIRIKDNGTARTLAWNAIYRIVGETLPTTTVANKTIYVGCIYNSSNSKWDVVAVKVEA